MKIYFILIFLIGFVLGEVIHIPKISEIKSIETPIIDNFKDGDVVEIINGEHNGYIGICKPTDPFFYKDGLRMVCFHVDPQGNFIVDCNFVEIKYLKKINKYCPNW